jgi:glutamate racemase
MPMVDKKKFPYTAKGKKEAKEYAMKTGKKVAAKAPKKMGAKRGY